MFECSLRNPAFRDTLSFSCAQMAQTEDKLDDFEESDDSIKTTPLKLMINCDDHTMTNRNLTFNTMDSNHENNSADASTMQRSPLLKFEKHNVNVKKIPANIGLSEVDSLIDMFELMDVSVINLMTFHLLMDHCLQMIPANEIICLNPPRRKDLNWAFDNADCQQLGEIDMRSFIDIYSMVKKDDVTGLAGYRWYECCQKSRRKFLKRRNAKVRPIVLRK